MSAYSHPSQWSRAIWAAGEPFVLGILFSAEGRESLTALGLPPLAAYVVLRSAPMGQADPAVVAAAFHSFPAAMIAEVLPDIWQRLTPEQVIAAHRASLPITAARVFGNTTDHAELERLGELLTRVCADLDTSGRPLAAGNQALRPPDEPWARLWQACTTLREYRGDAHIAALVAADLSVAESLVLTAAWADDHIDTTMLRHSRRLTDDIWAGAHDALVFRHLLTPDGFLTTEGTVLRDAIERQTDAASLRPVNAMDATDVEAVHRFLTHLSTSMLDARAVPAITAVGAPWPPPPLHPRTPSQHASS